MFIVSSYFSTFHLLQQQKICLPYLDCMRGTCAPPLPFATKHFCLLWFFRIERIHSDAFFLSFCVWKEWLWCVCFLFVISVINSPSTMSVSFSYSVPLRIAPECFFFEFNLIIEVNRMLKKMISTTIFMRRSKSVKWNECMWIKVNGIRDSKGILFSLVRFFSLEVRSTFTHCA